MYTPHNRISIARLPHRMTQLFHCYMEIIREIGEPSPCFAPFYLEVNCASSVEPFSAVVEEVPPVTMVAT